MASRTLKYRTIQSPKSNRLAPTQSRIWHSIDFIQTRQAENTPIVHFFLNNTRFKRDFETEIFHFPTKNLFSRKFGSGAT